MERKMICVQCGNQFVLQSHELERLKVRGFSPPKRCSDCRKHKSRSGDNNQEDRDFKRKRKQSRREKEFFEN